MINAYKDLYAGVSSTLRGAFTDDNYLYVLTSAPDFRKYNLQTLEQVNSNLTVSSTPKGIALIYGATGAAVFESSAVDFIDLNTNARTQVTTGASSTRSDNMYSQHIATIPASGFGISTRGTNGTVQAINGVNGTVSSLTVGGLTGAQATCVTVRPETNTFFIGSNDGKVHEINSSGATLRTLTLATTPNVGSAPIRHVVGISYCNPYLAILENGGAFYLYNYTASSYSYTGILESGNSSLANTNCSVFCTAASGTAYYGKGNTGLVGQSFCEVFFNANQPVFLPYYNETTAAMTVSAVSAANNRAFMATTLALNGVLPFREFTGGPFNQVQVNTRVQDSGTDVAARIIRIRDSGIGRTCVELDQNIPSLSTPLPATEGHNYIEIAIVSGPEKMDIREFQA